MVVKSNIAVTSILFTLVGISAQRDAFDAADIDHDGKIDRQEFREFRQSLRKRIDVILGEYHVDRLNDGVQNAARGDDVDAEVGVLDGVAKKLGPASKRKRMMDGAGFWPAFFSGVVTIWATEIGDKTFFIAAILSMKHERILVFSGAIGALAVMTVLSVAMGSIVSYLLPREVTHYLGAFLFVIFGVKMLKDGSNMNDGIPEELTEVEEELETKKTGENDTKLEEGKTEPEDRHNEMIKVLGQGFLLTFLAEWGDRSQIATIALSASKDPLGVSIGSIFGHTVCTGLAVIGGKILASRISERTVTLIGGVLFLLFAVHSFVFSAI